MNRDEIEKLLAGVNRPEPGQLDYCAIADAAPALARTCLNLMAQLEDAKAAQALVVERAAEAGEDYPRVAPSEEEWTRYDEQIEHSQQCIRALADPSGVEALAALRATLNLALPHLEENARWHRDIQSSVTKTEAAFAIVADVKAAIDQGTASPSVEKAMVRFWKKLAETHNSRAEKAIAERDDLRARLAAAEAQVGALVEALEGCVASLERADTKEGVCCCGDYMDNHSDPMGCGHTATDMGEYYADQAITAARAALASAQGGAAKTRNAIKKETEE